jgi:hypothetical protein
MRAQPDWYALLLTSSLIGYRPLLTTVSAPVATNFAAYAFAGPARTRKLLLIDDEPPGASPLEIRVPVGAGLGAGRVLRLTGPSLAATDGVRLGGRAVNASGTWRPPARGEEAPVRHGVLSLRLDASSGALVTVVPAVRKSHKRHRAGH